MHAFHHDPTIKSPGFARTFFDNPPVKQGFFPTEKKSAANGP